MVNYERGILDLLFKDLKVGKHPHLFLPYIPKEKVDCINIIMREGGDIRSFAGGMASQYPITFDHATIDFLRGQSFVNR